MSRHTIDTADKRITVVVGWDNPMTTFFGTVDRENEDPKKDPKRLLWLGGKFSEISAAAAMKGPMAPYAVLTDEMIAQLEADRSATAKTPPSALQVRMRALLEPLTSPEAEEAPKSVYLRDAYDRMAEAEGYFDLNVHTDRLADLLEDETCLDRLEKKYAMSAEEVIKRFCPGAYRDPATGAVEINAGYEPRSDEGELEAMIWEEVKVEVEALLKK